MSERMNPDDQEEAPDVLLDGADPQPSPSPPGNRVRSVIRGVGEVFITVGVLLLLMVAYQLWWTNVESSQAIAQERQDIEQSWVEPGQSATPTPTTSPTAPPTPVTDKPLKEPGYGTGFALMYIPRLADKVWGLPITQGTGKDVLSHGAGHYEDTAMPGGVGNFAVAAHRSSHSEPFANFPDLQVGDKVYVRTKDVWYVYTLTRDDPNLTPSDVWVIEPVPGFPESTPTKKLLTMTTCTPRYGSTGRWAWWGELTESRYVSDGPPDGINPAVVPTS